MKQNIVKVVKILAYLTFFVPLVVFPASFIFPFIVPKILTFRSLVELMMAGYILLLIINWQEFRPKFSWLSVAVAGFFASFAISTFVGVDPYHSFWDNHERMLGLFTIFHYVAYYFICTSVFKTWEDWRRALRVFLVAGSLVMFVGLLQVINPTLLLNQGTRIIATLGNPIYVGGYGLFLAFAAFLLYIKESNRIWKIAEMIMGLMAFIGLFFSGTRGSMLGFVVGIGLAVIGYIIFLKDSPKIRKTLIGVAVGGALVIVLLYAFKNSAFVQKIPAVNRAVLTSFETIKNSPRWIAWGTAVTSWKEKPVFGWGPNNFFYAFNKYYQPKSLQYGYGETWFDNAHNILVNTLSVQGAVGLVTYLSIFAAAISLLIVARRKGGVSIHITVLGISFLIAHLVQNVTVFENPTSYLYFMFWLAMIASLTALKPTTVHAKDSTIPASFDKKISMGAVTTVGLVFVFLVFIFNIQPARANMKTLDALKLLSYQPETSVEAIQAALAFNSPHIDDIRSDLARTAAQVLAGSADKIGKEKSLELFTIASDALKANVVLHPYDIRNYLSLSQLNQTGYIITGNVQYIAEYGMYLETALSYSPKRQQIIYNIANFYLQTGRVDEAVQALEGTINDDPKISEGYWRLAYIYKLSGNTNKAKEIINLAKENNIVFSAQEQEVISDILNTSSSPVTTSKK